MRIDLNCDMGEGCSSDAALMGYVSSVNIACGFHAGDIDTMRRTVKNAVKKGLAIGAHPGYRDRAGFGRHPMNVSANEIYLIVLEQIGALQNVCEAAGTALRHVKPHGALYNRSAKDVEIARAVAEAVCDFDDRLILFALAGSLAIDEAKRLGLKTASEAFADRTYHPDGSLTPRSHAGALIKNTTSALEQIIGIVSSHRVTATDGSKVNISADTVCIHGDGENALEFAAAIHDELVDRGIEIRPVWQD